MEKTAKLFPDLHGPATRDQITQFNELNGRLRGLATSPAIENLPEPWRAGLIAGLTQARAYALAGITAAGEAGVGASSSA